MPRLMSMCNTF